MVVTRDPRDENKKYIQNFGFKMAKKNSLKVTLVESE
jgi:hypothetical protein